MINFGRV